jgi:hypothetical protein
MALKRDSMIEYQIIEDCSPYFVRFTHEGIENIVNFCKNIKPDMNLIPKNFHTHKLTVEQSNELYSLVPMSKKIELQTQSSLYISKAGNYYRPHKDGVFNRFALNYTIHVSDELSQLNWYSDEELAGYEIDGYMKSAGISRECVNVVKENHTPLMSTTIRPNQCMLINTDLFHSVDNTKSPNERVILTLRTKMIHKEKMYLEDVRKILFNY